MSPRGVKFTPALQGPVPGITSPSEQTPAPPPPRVVPLPPVPAPLARPFVDRMQGHSGQMTQDKIYQWSVAGMGQREMGWRGGGTTKASTSVLWSSSGGRDLGFLFL